MTSSQRVLWTLRKTILHILSGILNVDKPRGITSHDVVSTVRRLAGIQAVGHTGTLDPEASGVLILCLGRATKFARFFEALDKTYWTVVRLGVRTDTQDATGRILCQHEVSPPSSTALLPVLEQFVGPQQQTPPMYSAVKYRGQRLYALARQGQMVVRQARDIVIKRLELLDARGPWLTLSVTCSKGTYIRTLCDDIGGALGCGAHMAHLQRCRVGPFTLQKAYTLDLLQQRARDGTFLQLLTPLAHALGFLPSLLLTPQQQNTLRIRPARELPMVLSARSDLSPAASSYRLCTATNRTFAIIQRHATHPEQWKFYTLDPADPGETGRE